MIRPNRMTIPIRRLLAPCCGGRLRPSSLAASTHAAAAGKPRLARNDRGYFSINPRKYPPPMNVVASATTPSSHRTTWIECSRYASSSAPGPPA
jgi:hypothetical protein